ncbi:MAG: DEAD/DEAH box helicase family protein [Erysipelotrichaceae bacterium]|nr:DEAD/DEAH box helicase family protein [Erysipelotrichaceae bacterium]
MENSKEELLAVIEQKNQRINELERLLKQYGIFVVDPNKKFSTSEKIQVFQDYFRCRTDIYAERYFSKKNNKYGWSPVCDNSFEKNCPKRQGKYNCFQCTYKAFRPLTSDILRDHFQGKNQGIGLYPMFDDNTTCILAIDFDDDHWMENMLSVYHEAVKYNIYPVMERSQSGFGGHLWFFFAEPIKALSARQFGEFFIREAMKNNKKIPFSSFDRMFPNQDYIPEEGKGNLIAAPLRYDAFLKGNSAFINTQQQVIANQIEYLASRPKITQEEISSVLTRRSTEDFFFENDQLSLRLTTDAKYARELSICVSSALRFEKEEMNAVTRNILLRCASMYNPKYYEMQRLHKPIYINSDFSRILSYFEEDDKYLYLPRGVLPVIQHAMPETRFHIEDQTYAGNSIDVEFIGNLRADQLDAAETMLRYDMGILQAVPGFGKTVIGLYLIANLKVNTLILVDSKEIQDQWEKRIEQFLAYPDSPKKKDRFVCKYNGSSKRLNGHIDIAMVRSLKNREDLSSLLKDYGLTIIDECHHVACDSFLHVMRHVRSKYIYGLSATPKREDGLFKVITMYCGQIRKQVSEGAVRKDYSFRQYLIPRYTNCRILKDRYSYTDMCSELMKDHVRNYMIVKDVLHEYREGSNIILLTERIEHLMILFEMLEKACDDVYMLSGAAGRNERKATLDEVRTNTHQYILLATSKLLGEGFDLPTLNCLFLVLPISSRTRITQYTGRIHRTSEKKDLVKVYDYVDTQIPMAQSMYYKRLKQYQREGYYVYTEHEEANVDQILYDKQNFEDILIHDIKNAQSEITIFTVKVLLSKVKKYHDLLLETVRKGVSVHFILSDEKQIDEQAKVYLEGTGANLISAQHGKHFVVIDRLIVWNCSFDFLNTVPSDGFATRDINSQAASEVVSSITIHTEDKKDDLFSLSSKNA